MAKKKNATEASEVTQSKDDISPAKLAKLLISEFNKDEDKSGKVAWNLATDTDNPTDVKEFISTGSTLLNYAISNRRDGGIPVCKLTEISGEEASGKSLICAHLIAETQRRGGIAVYIDTENSANPDFMSRVGVNISEMVYLQPQTVEEVGEAIEKTIIMARTRAPNKLVLIIWDSIAGTPTNIEVEGTFELGMDLQLAKSKVLSKMMRKITDTIGKERIALVFTNQLKVKIGVMYGDPMTTPGGKAVPYHASVRIRLQAGQKNKDAEDGDIYGVHTSAKIVKNRLGPPWRKVEFDILFASGIDDEGSWFSKLHELEEIEKADGWCYLKSIPSGRIEDKGVNAGKDRGFKFREKQFKEILSQEVEVESFDPKTGEFKRDSKGDPNKSKKTVKQHIQDLLEMHMIVRYNQKPKDLDLDPESLMDVESVTDAAMQGEL